MGTVSLIEVLWTLPLIPGLIASTLTLRDAFYEQRAARVRFSEGSAEEFTAHTTFIFEGTRWVQQAILLVVGVGAMFEAEPPHQARAGGENVLILFLVSFAYLLAFNSLYTRYYRREVRKRIRHDRGEKG